MKRQRRKESEPVTALVVCMAVLAVAIGLAQNAATAGFEDVLGFLNSPQGAAAAKRAQMLVRTSYAKQAFSNELARISGDTSLASAIRLSATEALQTYDTSATNSYQEIEAFVEAWPFRDEASAAAPVTLVTVGVMKRSLEIGSSATVHLQAFLCDTNIPAFYRTQVELLYSNMLHRATH